MGTHPGLALRSIVDCLQASLISIATLTHTFLYRQKSLRLIGEDYTIPYLRYCTTRTALLRERGENVEKLIVHYLRTTHLTRKTVVRSISSGPLRQTDRYISVHAHGVMTTPESNEMATLPPPLLLLLLPRPLPPLQHTHPSLPVWPAHPKTQQHLHLHPHHRLLRYRRNRNPSSPMNPSPPHLPLPHTRPSSAKKPKRSAPQPKTAPPPLPKSTPMPWAKPYNSPSSLQAVKDTPTRSMRSTFANGG